MFVVLFIYFFRFCNGFFVTLSLALVSGVISRRRKVNQQETLSISLLLICFFVTFSGDAKLHNFCSRCNR
jgi:hypothetical protein